MSSSLKLLSQTDNRTKYAVYGWIRQAEKELQIGNIPTKEIGSICILYYRADEIFDSVGSEVILSEDKRTITKTDPTQQDIPVCNYGLIQIPTNGDSICRWDLRINKKEMYSGIRIGLSTTRTMGKFWEIVSNNDTEKNTLCLYSSYAARFDPIESEVQWPDYGKEYGENDVVSIILDLTKRSINYLLNDKDQGIAYENIGRNEDTKYQLLVALESQDDCVEIINFSRS